MFTFPGFAPRLLRQHLGGPDQGQERRPAGVIDITLSADVQNVLPKGGLPVPVTLGDAEKVKLPPRT